MKNSLNPPTEKWQMLYHCLIDIISRHAKENIEEAFWVSDEAHTENEQRIRVTDFELISSELIVDMQSTLTKDFPQSTIYVRSLNAKQSICVLEITHDKAELRCY